MAYTTPEGQEIKAVAIKVKKLQELFSEFANKLPYQLLRELDLLEYKVLNCSEIIELGKG